jgi:hypothetical protein
VTSRSRSAGLQPRVTAALRALHAAGYGPRVPGRRSSRAPPLLLERGDDDGVEEDLGAAADRVRRRVEDDLAIP